MRANDIMDQVQWLGWGPSSFRACLQPRAFKRFYYTRLAPTGAFVAGDDICTRLSSLSFWMLAAITLMVLSANAGIVLTTKKCPFFLDA